MLDALALDIQEGISITDDPDILATIYPALLKLAQAELFKRKDRSETPEDLVHGAVVRFLEASPADVAYPFLRAQIRNRARDLARELHDLSLEAERA